MMIVFITEHINYAGRFYAKHARSALYPESAVHCCQCGWHPNCRYFGKRYEVCCLPRFIDPGRQTSLSLWTKAGSED